MRAWCPFYFKPTRLSVNFVFGASGVFGCSGDGHRHARLQGAVLLRRPDGSQHWRWATSFAAQFLPQLCLRLFEAAAAAAPADARRLRARRAGASRRSPGSWRLPQASAHRVLAPKTPEAYHIGWEDAIRTWGFQLPGPAAAAERIGRSARKRRAGHGGPASGHPQARPSTAAARDGTLGAGGASPPDGGRVAVCVGAHAARLLVLLAPVLADIVLLVVLSVSQIGLQVQQVRN